MNTKVFETMVSNMLYEHRFGPYFVGTIVAGLDTDKNGVTKPYISGTDLIGAIESPPDFVTAGSASNQLMGICQTWKHHKQKQLIMVFKLLCFIMLFENLK